MRMQNLELKFLAVSLQLPIEIWYVKRAQDKDKI